MEPLAEFGTVAFDRWASGTTRRLAWRLPRVGDGGLTEKRRAKKQVIGRCLQVGRHTPAIARGRTWQRQLGAGL